MNAVQHLFVPLIFWVNMLRARLMRRFKPAQKVIEVPQELLPLLQVGTLAMGFARYAEVEPEELGLSQKLDDVVRGRADMDSILFVEKVLFGKDLFNTVFDWLVFVGDAEEDERESFATFLQLEPLGELRTRSVLENA